MKANKNNKLNEIKQRVADGPELCNVNELESGKDNNDIWDPCEGCGLSARQMFYDMMEDDEYGGHICKPNKPLNVLSDILLVILFFGISLMLVISFFLLGAYLRSVF